MPTSVLLAVLAAAGLLALAPALVRRYDATERLVAERAVSPARVLARCGALPDGDVTRRRRRTVPGRRPVNPPRSLSPVGQPAGSATSTSSGRSVELNGASAPPASALAGSAGLAGSSSARASRSAAGAARAGSAHGSGQRRAPNTRPRRASAVHRRRRVFAALVLLNVVEVVGLVCVGPAFWIGSVASLALLCAYVAHLRRRAVSDRRRRQLEIRRAAWLAVRAAEAERQQARRLAARREALRRAAAARAAAQRASVRLSQRYDVSTGRAVVRGRPYSQRAAGF